MAEFFRFVAQGIDDFVAQVRSKLSSNGWVYMGISGGDTFFYRNAVGDIRAYISLSSVSSPSSQVRFRSYLYVDDFLNTSDAKADGSNNTILFSDPNLLTNTVGIVDDQGLTLFCDQSHYLNCQVLSCGLVDRSFVLPTWGSGWCRGYGPVLPGSNVVVSVDRDIRDNIRTGQKISIVEMKTGALVSDHTTVVSATASTVTLATVTGTYGASVVLGLLPVPCYCTEAVPYPGINVLKTQFVLDLAAQGSTGILTAVPVSEMALQDLDAPVFRPFSIGAGPIYLTRMAVVDPMNEGILGILPHISVMPNSCPLSPKIRIATRMAQDPTEFWIAPFGSQVSWTGSGIPLLGPGASLFRDLRDRHGIEKTISSDLSILKV